MALQCYHTATLPGHSHPTKRLTFFPPPAFSASLLHTYFVTCMLPHPASWPSGLPQSQQLSTQLLLWINLAVYWHMHRSVTCTGHVQRSKLICAYQCAPVGENVKELRWVGEHVQESSKGPAGWQRRWGGDGRGVDTGVTIRFQPFSLWSTRPTLQRKYVQYCYNREQFLKIIASNFYVYWNAFINKPMCYMCMY